jgi:hypothetical protein
MIQKKAVIRPFLLSAVRVAARAQDGWTGPMLEYRSVQTYRRVQAAGWRRQPPCRRLALGFDLLVNCFPNCGHTCRFRNGFRRVALRADPASLVLSP